VRHLAAPGSYVLPDLNDVLLNLGYIPARRRQRFGTNASRASSTVGSAKAGAGRAVGVTRSAFGFLFPYTLSCAGVNASRLAWKPSRLPTNDLVVSQIYSLFIRAKIQNT
jgi:hypothetical protein